METALKLLTAIVARRLQQALAATNPLCAEQAGFRTKEECAAHIAALHEVCERRSREGKQTVLAFIDFRQAFDRVPHGALLRKLEVRGVCRSGQTLAFIRALYTNPYTIVTLPGGGRGERINVERGVRQGCPLSPVLFNVFIDDILEGVEGVSVPRMRDNVRGFLFADDVAIPAESVECMCNALSVVEQWAEENHMECNANKCGLMVVGGDMAVLREAKLELSGGEIPVVESYPYLGYPFNSNLDVKAAAAARAEKGQTKLNMMTRFLTNKLIPLAPKLDALRACLLPSLTYGGEMFGMNKSIVAKLESVWSKAVKMIVKGWGKPAAQVVQYELGLFNIYQTTSAQRARAFLKFPTLATIIADLCASPVAKSWFGKTRTWLRSELGAEYNASQR